MNQMGNLEKLGILVIVILVVVVGVVAITPKEQVDSALFAPEDTPGMGGAPEPLDPPGGRTGLEEKVPAENGSGSTARGGASTDPRDWPLGTDGSKAQELGGKGPVAERPRPSNTP